ncbi:TNF receptor-associated factor 4 [Oopsacas minuta]|uniref:TNF receptor-associated factor 4 n=1 Tax=Oopsacas minuta TaxID=111878 RepID=A0AAV7JGS1_9METZ|nr:TNF receptor-associated factor 4 [Oopsacas minuta]
MQKPDVREKLLYIQTEDGFNGFKRELLTTQLTPIEDSFLACNKCKGIMREACSTNEGLLQVCFMCIENPQNPYQNLVAARKSVLELNVKCPLQKRGCDWNGKICEISQHVDECPCYQIECSLDCGVIHQRKSALQHINIECTMRPVNCEFCDKLVSPTLLIQHLNECENTKMDCNSCGMQVKKINMEFHLKTECSERSLPCTYAQYGCSAIQLKKDEVKDHMRINNELHTALLSEYIASTQTDIMERICQLEEVDKHRSAQIEELTKQNNKLSNKIRHLNNVFMTSLAGSRLRWKISGFASDTTLYESPTFSLEGYIFKCSISIEDAKAHVKVSTLKSGGDKNAKWPFRGKSIVMLVNQDREDESLYFHGDEIELARNFYETPWDSVNQNKRICSIPIASVIRDPFCKKGTVMIYVLVQSLA